MCGMMLMCSTWRLVFTLWFGASLFWITCEQVFRILGENEILPFLVHSALLPYCLLCLSHGFSGRFGLIVIASRTSKRFHPQKIYFTLAHLEDNAIKKSLAFTSQDDDTTNLKVHTRTLLAPNLTDKACQVFQVQFS